MPRKSQLERLKEIKKEDTEIPIDTVAINAFSSVIADATKDSEPAAIVQYTLNIREEE